MKPLFGNGKKSARLMFIADNPTAEEYEAGKYLSNKAGKLLKAALEQLGVNIKKDCYFTAVYKCPTPNDRQPVKDEIKAHEKFLLAEIEVIKPEIIVPMGNVALKLVHGRVGITKFRGKPIEKEGYTVFPILHPNMIFQQPKYAKLFAKDLQNLVNFLNGNIEEDKHEYRYLETLEEVREEIQCMMSAEWVCFDIEGTGLNPFLEGAKIACISLTDRPYYGVTIPTDHPESPFNEEEKKEVIQLLKQLLENPNIKKMAHNGKFDIKWLRAIYGIEVKNFQFDPMLAHYIAVSEERGNQGLKELTAQYFPAMAGYDDELERYKLKLPEKERNNYCNIPWKILREYAAADVDCTFRLYEIFYPMIQKDEGWKFVYENLLIPGSYMLVDLETNGVRIDPKRLEEFKQAYENRMKEIEEKLRQYPEVIQIEREKHELYKLRQLEMKKPKEERNPEILKYNKYKNFKFNFSSPHHLRELLFVKLGLDTPYLTAKGEEKKMLGQEITIQDLSTGSETLEYLKDKHPIAKYLAEWRRVEKLYGTYIKPAEEWIGTDGRVHGTLNLTGTVTGRLSSENPNMQNIPRKVNDPDSFEWKYGPKRMFVSRFGDQGIILQFDYSQLELRVAAIFSNDPALVQAYNEGKDVHRYVASKVFGVPEDKVTDDQRTQTKAVNFGLIYGKGAKSLAEDMKVSLEEAEEFLNKYFEEFKGVKQWLDKMKETVRKKKYVKTLTGRWRRLPGIDSNRRGVVNEALRMATNAPIQGTGSDITLISLIRINNELKKRKLKSCLCITVHDSIVLDVYVPEFPEVFHLVKEIMENPPYDWVTVPIVAEAEIGRDYGALVGIDSLDDLKGYKDVFEYIDTKWAEKEKKLREEMRG